MQSTSGYHYSEEQYQRYIASWTTRTIDEFYNVTPAAQNRAAVSGNADAVALRVNLRRDYSECYIKEDTGTTFRNRNSILLDPGSRINVIGEKTMETFVKAALNATPSQDTTFESRNPLEICGVGEGAATSNQIGHFPIAVKFDKEDYALKTVFKANVAKGCGAQLPAILGGKSMEEKNSILCFKEGEQQLVFPGPGGYKIELSPGSKVLPVKTTPSGHYVVLCDDFSSLPAHCPEPTVSFHVDHTTSLWPK